MHVFYWTVKSFPLAFPLFLFFIFAPPMRNAGANADSEFARRPFKRRCVRVFAAGFARKHAPASARKISAVAEYFPSAFRIFLRPLLAPHLKDGKRAPSVFEFYFMRGIRTRLRRPGIAGCAPIPKKIPADIASGKIRPSQRRRLAGSPARTASWNFRRPALFRRTCVGSEGKGHNQILSGYRPFPVSGE